MISEAYLNSILEKLENTLTVNKYLHSIGVMNTAALLAAKYDYSLIDKAMIAGALHDCAKCIPKKEMIKILEDDGYVLSDIEYKYGSTLHAPAGVIVAKRDFNITDEEILSAIRWHTTGKANMSTLDKIIYIADFIEPMRFYNPGLQSARDKVLNNSLDEALTDILSGTLKYLREKNSNAIDPFTNEAYNYYKGIK